MNLKDNIQQNLEKVSDLLKRACEAAGRKFEDVIVLPVTKRQSLEKIEALYELGFREFGENRVQEMNEKALVLPDDIKWHMIGSLQSNKVRSALESASVIHSVDSFKLLKRIDRIAEEDGKCPEILLQVNISGEESKSGFTPESVEEAVTLALGMSHLRLTGFMTMAPANASEEEIFQYFCDLKALGDRYNLKELSMGMSGDFEIAVKAGSTCVRIGSLLLGERQP